MAPRGLHLGLVMASVLLVGASAQSTSNCISTIISLSPCLSYISGNASTPTSSCCTQLASVVSSQPQCLCMVINSGGVPSLGITINRTQALELPGACQVKTPPVSRCNSIGGAPTASPSPISSTVAGAPDGSIAPAPGPSSGVGSTSCHVSIFLTFASLFLTAYLSISLTSF